MLELKRQLENELLQNILPFWMRYTVDYEQGGFYGKVHNDLRVEKEAAKGGTLNARILWTFSAAYKMYGTPAFLEMAQRAYHYIEDFLWDKNYGGVYWLVDYQGSPLDNRKQLYTQAFAIYAFIEYYRATGTPAALEKAKLIFELMNAHGHDQEYGGYFEACNREWAVQDFFLDGQCGKEKKSMNTMLHILEAYTNLYRVWKDETLRNRLQETLEMFIEHIVEQETGHFKLFFDETWQNLTNEISYGHDIEGSWLLPEAAEVLGDHKLQQLVATISLKMAEITAREGLDADGGIVEGGDPEGITNADRSWWPQAEAVVGFIHAYQLTGREDFRENAEKVWKFIQEKLIDHENGEWFSCSRHDGSIAYTHGKADMWKCPYHNSRMCLEIIERVKEKEGEAIYAGEINELR